MADKKKAIVAIVGIAIVVAIAASFSSYMGQIEQQVQSNDTESQILSMNIPPVLGSETAPVTIIKMGDYLCEMCKRWYDNTKPKIVENFIDTGKVNLVFIDLPILGFDSKIAAQATYCANDQGKYWDYYATLYDYQGHMNSGWANSDRLKAFAFNLDLNMDEFDECLDSNKYKQRVEFNANKAKSGGANSTPTFVIVNSEGVQKKIVGAQPYSVFEAALNSLL